MAMVKNILYLMMRDMGSKKHKIKRIALQQLYLL